MFPLVTSPHPVLRQPTRLVGDRLDTNPTYWANLAHALESTMQHFAGVGIAAPQIAHRSRFCVIDRDVNRVLIDAEIVDRGGEQESTEGCLSLPGESWTVARAAWVEYRYRDLDGVWWHHRAEGFEATVVQHELDHLDGVLLDDRSRSAGPSPETEPPLPPAPVPSPAAALQHSREADA